MCECQVVDELNLLFLLSDELAAEDLFTPLAPIPVEPNNEAALAKVSPSFPLGIIRS